MLGKRSSLRVSRRIRRESLRKRLPDSIAATNCSPKKKRATPHRPTNDVIPKDKLIVTSSSSRQDPPPKRKPFEVTPRLETSIQHREILKQIPAGNRKLFGKVGFAQLSRIIRPVVFYCPFDLDGTCPARQKWRESFNKLKDQGRLGQLPHLVYWYGEKDTRCYALVPQRCAVLYHEAKDDPVFAGTFEAYNALRGKVANGQKLSNTDKKMLPALQEMDVDLSYAPRDRSRYANTVVYSTNSSHRESGEEESSGSDQGESLHDQVTTGSQEDGVPGRALARPTTQPNRSGQHNPPTRSFGHSELRARSKGRGSQAAPGRTNNNRNLSLIQRACGVTPSSDDSDHEKDGDADSDDSSGDRKDTKQRVRSREVSRSSSDDCSSDGLFEAQRRLDEAVKAKQRALLKKLRLETSLVEKETALLEVEAASLRSKLD